MIGPTGVGKTEIARRLAKLAASPFSRSRPASSPRSGYYGRDVESIVRDLVRDGRGHGPRGEDATKVKEKAAAGAEEKLLDLLLPAPSGGGTRSSVRSRSPNDTGNTREKIRASSSGGGLLEDRRRRDRGPRTRSMPMEMFSNQGMEQMDFRSRRSCPDSCRASTQERKVTVAEAREVLFEQEERRLDRHGPGHRLAVERVEQSGIVFLDELDKIAGRRIAAAGPTSRREGVQRDLLPIVEGTTVNTRYGLVRTDHILFIAAGAFHVAKPADLMPELQGRFPIRVELATLTKEDFVRILTEPENALIKQYEALLETEGVEVTFTEDAIDEIAQSAEQVNHEAENIGARRLHTIMEKVLEEIARSPGHGAPGNPDEPRIRAGPPPGHPPGPGSQAVHPVITDDDRTEDSPGFS